MPPTIRRNTHGARPRSQVRSVPHRRLRPSPLAAYMGRAHGPDGGCPQPHALATLDTRTHVGALKAPPRGATHTRDETGRNDEKPELGSISQNLAMHNMAEPQKCRWAYMSGAITSPANGFTSPVRAGTEPGTLDSATNPICTRTNAKGATSGMHRQRR